MTARTLEDVTTPDGSSLTVDEAWLQGRGAYGGLPIAASIRAIERRIADPRRQIRTVTAELPAPTVPGVASIDVDILRSGNNLTVARATMRQGEHATCHVVAVAAARREGANDVAWRELHPPDVPPWESLRSAPHGEGFPRFAAHFDYRIASGIPYTGGATVTTGWVASRAPGRARDAAYIAAMIDVWYPAFLVRAPRPRPLATIAYTLELVDGLDGLPADEPLIYRGSVPVSHDGYFLETRELWGRDGRLIARNHQTFAIIA